MNNILGIPGEGIHKHWLGIAIWDVVITIIAAVFLAYTTGQSFMPMLIGLFLVGEGMHLIFGVKTAVLAPFS